MQDLITIRITLRTFTTLFLTLPNIHNSSIIFYVGHKHNTFILTIIAVRCWRTLPTETTERTFGARSSFDFGWWRLTSIQGTLGCRLKRGRTCQRSIFSYIDNIEFDFVFFFWVSKMNKMNYEENSHSEENFVIQTQEKHRSPKMWIRGGKMRNFLRS